MGKFLLIMAIMVGGFGGLGQDTLARPQDKTVHWLVGADGLSALNVVSLIGGIEHNRSRYSISLSHMFGSSRVGFYYDFCVHREYKFFVGLGYHNSFKFNAFDTGASEYRDSLIRTDQEAKTSTISFLPDYGETRLQYFGSFSISKEFKIYKGLCFNFKVMLVYGYNPYYRHGDFWPAGGVQFYYKW